MALLTIHNGLLAYGDHPLLDNADFALQENERVCLVGRNGAGKSTLMKVLDGNVILDDGKLTVTQDVVVSRLEQDPPRNQEGTVFDYVAGGLAEIGEQIKIYQDQLDLIGTDPSEQNINKLARIQEQLEHNGAWRFEDRIKNVLAALKLDGHTKLTDLSGGWQRKRRWLVHWCVTQMFYFLMSLLTTLMLLRLSGLKTSSKISVGRSYLSLTTVHLSNRWQRALSILTVANLSLSWRL